MFKFFYENRALCEIMWKNMEEPDRSEVTIYRVIHKSLRDFRTRLRNNQDRHGRKEHINRYRISPSFFFVLGALAYFQVPPLGGSPEEKWRSQ